MYPLIEGSEKKDHKDLMDGFESLKRYFPNEQIGILHGRMKSENKDYEMKRFSSGTTKILVSTTVIEVGVDVPNASVIIIESAERFGLSQLHQLRGRVGRGDKQSECIFHITEGKSFSKITKDGQDRLNAIEQNDDGFKLSELDLQIRGEGKVTGTSQSGLSDLKIANLRTDYEILETSKEYFSKIEDEKIKSDLYAEANLLFPNFGKTKDST